MWTLLKDFGHRWLRGLDYAGIDPTARVGSDQAGALYHQSHADSLVVNLVARSAVRAELVVALCRGAFVALVLGRFLLIDENLSGSGLSRASIEVPVLVVTMVILLALVTLAVAVRSDRPANSRSRSCAIRSGGSAAALPRRTSRACSLLSE